MTRPTPAPRHFVTRRGIPGLDTDAGDARVPTQERGTRRVEAILDAAAELVTELGVEGVTPQALADRAATSKGSLYHLFPDVSAVLRALGRCAGHATRSRGTPRAVPRRHRLNGVASTVELDAHELPRRFLCTPDHAIFIWECHNANSCERARRPYACRRRCVVAGVRAGTRPRPWERQGS